MTMISRIEQAVSFIRERADLVPDVGLVLGSGLGVLADEVEGEQIAYADIPGFPDSTAPSHKGTLHVGTLAGRKVVAMQGRVHLYEGYQPSEVAFPMRVMAGLGAKQAILTNAAGGLDPSIEVGDLVAIEDHLSMANLAGADPLRGPNDDRIGPRFVSMNGAYDKGLIAAAESVADSEGITLKKGVYAFVTGPSFETPAEVRLLQTLNCHVDGMSTVPEVIAARHHGLQVLAISAVTNTAVSSVQDTHVTNVEEVWDATKAIQPRLKSLVRGLLSQ